MPSILPLLVACLVTLWMASASAEPRFVEFKVAKIHRGKSKAPDLSSPDAHAFRTRLRQAARGKVNLAGHYILATWGCGATCVTGAAIDALTGRVVFLPFTVCCWGAVDDAFAPVAHRADSRLIVFSGLRNEEEPMGAHYYELRNGEFKFLQTVDSPADFR